MIIITVTCYQLVKITKLGDRMFKRLDYRATVNKGSGNFLFPSPTRCRDHALLLQSASVSDTDAFVFTCKYGIRLPKELPFTIAFVGLQSAPSESSRSTIIGSLCKLPIKGKRKTTKEGSANFRRLWIHSIMLKSIQPVYLHDID